MGAKRGLASEVEVPSRRWNFGTGLVFRLGTCKWWEGNGGSAFATTATAVTKICNYSRPCMKIHGSALLKARNLKNQLHWEVAKKGETMGK